jgi:hypothetical protein
VEVDRNVCDVDRDRGLAPVGDPVWAAPMHASLSRKGEPLKRLRVVLILGDENVAVYLDGVIHPPLHEVGAVVEHLLRAVRGESSAGPVRTAQRCRHVPAGADGPCHLLPIQGRLQLLQHPNWGRQISERRVDLPGSVYGSRRDQGQARLLPRSCRFDRGTEAPRAGTSGRLEGVGLALIGVRPREIRASRLSRPRSSIAGERKDSGGCVDRASALRGGPPRHSRLRPTSGTYRMPVPSTPVKRPSSSRRRGLDAPCTIRSWARAGRRRCRTGCCRSRWWPSP